MMFASASGVLKQRASPNARCKPNVMPNTPPLPGTSSITSGSASATSSPNTRMRSSRAICSCSVRRIASPNVTTSASAACSGSPGSSVTGIGPTTCCVTVAGSGRARRERLLRPRPAPSPSLPSRMRSASSAVSAPIEISCCASTVIGSCSASSSSSSELRYFFWSSESECEYGPRDQRVDEARPGAGTHTRDRVGALAAHLEVVAAVHLHDVQPADAAHHLGDGRGRLVGRAHRDRVTVVGDDVEHRAGASGTRC